MCPPEPGLVYQGSTAIRDSRGVPAQPGTCSTSHQDALVASVASECMDSSQPLPEGGAQLFLCQKRVRPVKGKGPLPAGGLLTEPAVCYEGEGGGHPGPGGH